MTTPFDSPIPPEVMADMQAVTDALCAGRPVDPEVAQRIRERSKKAQEEMLRLHGIREIAVELIRASRDEE